MTTKQTIKNASQVAASKNTKRVIRPDYVGPSIVQDDQKKFGSEIGSSHFSPEFSKQLIKPVKDWKFSFGRHKDTQLQDANSAQLRPWCRWLTTKIPHERPISAAYAQAYLDGKSFPTVCDWSKNEYPFLTVGRYRGFPINMVAIEHPDYFRWLLQSDLASSLSDAFKEYIEEHCVKKV